MVKTRLAAAGNELRLVVPANASPASRVLWWGCTANLAEHVRSNIALLAGSRR